MRNRENALNWWRSKTVHEQVLIIQKWREITQDKRKEWTVDMISASSSTIQKIYEECG